MIDQLEKERCTGCAACVSACPARCIAMEPDEEGFLYPAVDLQTCTSCGKCEQACPAFYRQPTQETNLSKRTCAVRNKDGDILRRSSSGGVFYALAAHVIGLGGSVYGAAFTETFSVCHVRIDRAEDIPRLMGSKYVQSDTTGIYPQVEEDLRQGRTVLFTGTPCQIAAVRSYIGCDRDRLFCVSVICHGVPSPEVWRRYLALKKGQFAKDSIQNVSFRDKTFGWQYFSLRIDFEDGYYIDRLNSDLYMRGFLDNLFLRPVCYQCAHKGRETSADLIIGDYWGIAQEHPGFANDEGTSCIVIRNERGKELWNAVIDKFAVEESGYDAALNHNPPLGGSFSMNRERDAFFGELQISGTLEEAIRNHLDPTFVSWEEQLLSRYPVLYRYLKQLLAGRTLSNALCDMGMARVALYAVTDLMELALADIQRSDRVLLVCIACRNPQKYEGKYGKIPVLGVEKLVRMEAENRLDGVIICNPVRENEIYSELAEAGFPAHKLYPLDLLVTGT